MDDLPSSVLEQVFRHCEGSTLAVIPVVSKHWQQVFCSSVTPLPPIKLCGPLYRTWLQQYGSRLRKLVLRRVEDLECVECVRNLQSLNLEECRHLEDLSPLTQLTGLQNFAISSCRSIRDLQPLCDITQLHSLTIDRCFARDLTPLSGHPGLQELQLAFDCWSVMHLALPGSLPALTRMRVMSAIQDIEPLACFTGLRELELYCVSLYDLSALSCLTELQDLDLHTLQEANGLHAGALSPLSALSKLRSLGLQGSDASIVDICPWHCLTGLTKVDLHGSCTSNLKPLTALTGLQELDLTEARELCDLSPLSGLMHLSELVLTGCRQVRDLRPVLHLQQLNVIKR